MAEWQDGFGSYATSADRGEAQVEFEDVLYDYFNNFSWNYTGVLKEDSNTIPIPKVSNCDIAIFEVDPIGSQEDMGALQNREPVFNSDKEFEED